MQDQEEIVLSTDEKGWLGKIKDGIYENWQTVLVAVIVLIVGISAYYYNERPAETPAASEQENSQAAAEAEASTAEEQNAEAADAAEASAEDQNAAAEQTAPAASEETKTKEDTAVADANTVTVEGENYKVTAVKGEGLTHLARKAMNQYLEKNPNDQVTSLHKIYIEDYLRKQVAASPIEIGHAETFSQGMIEQAIAASQKLSAKQLDNLKKYELQK